MRQWLAMSPDVKVVAIYPWPQIKGPDPFWDSHPIRRLHTGQFREPDGLYLAFLATMWVNRNSVISAHGNRCGNGCGILPVPHALGLRLDLIYIDADKRGAEISICD